VSDAGLDHEWVMQATFVLSLAVGVPVVVMIALLGGLPELAAIPGFVLRVGAVVWLVLAILLALYDHRYR
jgi:hypothetical protein